MRRLAPHVANAIDRRGRTIYLRTETVVNGEVNPAVVTNPRLTQAAAAQATTISIDADSATGFLAPNDALQINGQWVAVTAQVFARTFAEGQNDGFDDVPITPGLKAALAAGTTLCFRWLNDKRLKALLDYFPAHIVDGTNFLMRDLRIQVGALGNTTRQNPPAYTNQKLIVDGDIRSVVECLPIEGPGGEITKWMIQAR